MTLTSHPSPSDLRKIRLYYFIFTGAGGFIIPFLNLFYRRQGLSGTQIGLLATIGAITALIIAPFWGRWSDRITDPRRLLQGAFVGSAVVYLLISQQNAFVWLAVLACFNGFLGSGMDPLSDAMTLAMIKDVPKTGFGSIRLWGSLGWAVVVLAAGWLIEQTGVLAGFIGYAVMIVLTAAVLGWLNYHKTKPETKDRLQSVATGEMLKLVTQDRALIGLAIAIGISWLTRSGLYQFQAIYLDQLGAGEALIGLGSTLGALVELPAMLWADRLIRQRGSHQLVGFTFLVYAFMNVCVLAFPAVPTIIAMSAVGGIAFSFYNVGLVVFIGERAPLGQTATTLALYTSTLRGLIVIAAGPLAGAIFDAVGAYWLYAVALGGSIISWLVFRLLVSGNRSLIFNGE